MVLAGGCDCTYCISIYLSADLERTAEEERAAAAKVAAALRQQNDGAMQELRVRLQQEAEQRVAVQTRLAEEAAQERKAAQERISGACLITAAAPFQPHRPRLWRGECLYAISPAPQLWNESLKPTAQPPPPR